jgi:hypothetical protein
MPDYIPKPDGEMAAFTETVIAALEADEAAYGLVAAQTLALRAAQTAFTGSLTNSNTKKAEAQIAVADKDSKRQELEDALRPIVAQIQVNPIVTDELRLTASLPVRDTVRTVSSPIPPAGLVANADASGVNVLTWNSNGNASGIRYVVEAKIANAGEFSLVDVVTATSYRHLGRTPGQPVLYRVLARRGAETSQPSNVAGVYQ